MTVQLTIIGLGQIGTSVGLALAEESERIFRLGHDRELGAARRAEKMGALDKVSINLHSAVEEADLVLLALPVDQIKETLEFIREDLKPAARRRLKRTSAWTRPGNCPKAHTRLCPRSAADWRGYSGWFDYRPQ